MNKRLARKMKQPRAVVSEIIEVGDWYIVEYDGKHFPICITLQRRTNTALQSTSRRQEAPYMNTALHKQTLSMIATETVPVTEKQSAVLIEDAQGLGIMLEENSPGKLLWEEQMKAIENNKHMRWHPSIIRWCILFVVPFV